MTEQSKNEILTIKQEKSPEEDKKDDINQNNEEKGKEVCSTIEVQKNVENINTEERLNNNITNKEPANIKLELNEKNIYQLSQETISKLNFPPCIICQSQNFSLYIPDSSPSPSTSPDNDQPQQVESDTKKGGETDMIKPSKDQLFLPLLICEQNHQLCLICHQNPHVNVFCSHEYMRNDYINSIFDIVKEAETIPEEKKEILNTMRISALNSGQSSNSCCTCKCTWSIIFLIFGLLFWTIASVVLVVIGLAFIALSLALRVLCCLYHLCYQACCTTSTTTTDKGSYIEEVTTVHVGKQRADEAEAEEHDDCLANCGPLVLAYSILLIPKGYTKIFEIYASIKN